MPTLSLRVSEEEKTLISNFAKEKYLTISEFILKSALEKIEDEEDYILGEARFIDPKKSEVIGDLRTAAEKFGIDYDKL